MRRYWTEEDRETIRALYLTTTGSVLAKRLGRSVRSVHNQARLLGIRKHPRAAFDDAFRARLRELNAAGYSDHEIADTIGGERHTVSKYRQAMGLPSNARGNRYRERVRANTRRQCGAVGAASLAELKVHGGEDVRENLASKLKTARSLTGMSTRAVSAKLVKRFAISHATLANYESGRTVPPMDVLATLAELYERPLNWFLERGRGLSGIQYRNLKSRVRMSELHTFEADVQRWIDAYVALEVRLGHSLKNTASVSPPKPGISPDDLSRTIRRELKISEEEPISSVVEMLERFGIRVLENPTELRIDGLAAKYDDEFVVVLNPTVSNDRTRLNAAHELGHVLYGDCDSDEPADKVAEQRAFEFASHLLLPNNQLKRAFEGQSMVRLVQFKERFGISLAAMVYRAEKLGFIPKPTAKTLWIEFARRGWKTKEPGTVRPDRATRFEQLIDEALVNRKLSLKELADLAGVRPEAIRERLNFAMGIDSDGIPEDEGMNTIEFPR
jgi:Zn-dependent peptidase ImmA (M78 family)